MTSNEVRRNVRDAEVKRGFEIGSDQYLLTAKISIPKTVKKRKKKYEKPTK